MSSPNVISIVDYKKPFNIDLGSITDYFSTALASDGNLDRRALKNGNRLFKDHFVFNISITRDYMKRKISAKCRAQMKKSVTYQIHMIINVNRPADILEASCQCVAGKGDRAECKHVAALCFALLDYDTNQMYEACTERLQQWHQPTRKSTNPMNILDIKFTHLQHNKTEEDKPKYLKFLQSDIYIPEATTTLQQLLIKYDQQNIAAASILLTQQVIAARIPLPSRVITQVPLPPSLLQNPTSAMFKYYTKHIYLTFSEISMLEQNTIGQASSAAWYEAKQFRISSTNVHLISTRKQNFETLTQTILQQRKSNLHSNIAIRHGIINEEVCRCRYVSYQARNGIISTTYPCGLVVDPTASHICCSPDAIVKEESNNNTSYGILECKCVFAESDATWDDLIFIRENFCLERYNGQLRLRPGHPYYYQLIALMGILDLPWIDICVMKNEDLHIERFTHDEHIWSTIKEKLTNFYVNFFLPEIININA
ncbi:unnamed protein product [Rotaria magnacalcarata]|uniref:SWIM-type domain-containing protein n=2 Tax=Rotaria magnacalcarata TaxID=392030 RepID=A0A816MAY5_9BILA|nr:unnamed protein product [Rotaria magnacalcarata]CAF4308338.1 unnamed protein product [Rotaria magnacalcarata]